jgi:hypothetical protein
MMNYFFYKDYMFNKMIKHSDPLWVSAIFVSIIEFVNGLSVFIILNHHIFHLEPSTTTSIASMMILGVILFILNAKYYGKNKMLICEKYKGEKLFINILGYIFYIVYLTGSFVLLYILNDKLGYYL